MTTITLPKAVEGQTFEIKNMGNEPLTIQNHAMDVVQVLPKNPIAGQQCVKQSKDGDAFCMMVYDGEEWRVVSSNGSWEESLFDSFMEEVKIATAGQLSELYNKIDEFKLEVERKLLERC